MRVAITGAGGFIGGALSRKLVETRNEVICFDIDKKLMEANLPSERVIIHELSFKDYGRLHDLIPQGLDAFVHFAWSGGLTTSLSDFDIQIENVKYACLAAQEAKTAGVKEFMLISSNYQYMVWNSDDSMNASIYGIAKQTAEKMCSAVLFKSDTRFRTAVLGNTFGPGDHSRKAVNTFVRKLLADEDLQLVEGSGKNDWMFIDETVNGIMALLQHQDDRDKVYVGHRDISSFRDKLVAMKKILKSKSRLLFGSYPDLSHVDYSKVEDFCIDSTYLDSCPFEQAILKTAEWICRLDGDVFESI